MKKIIIYIVLITGLFSACVENPNVTEDVYLSNPHAVSSWLNGLKRQLAKTSNTVTINVAITSDNYFNNYSQYSKVFDVLQIDYFDVDVNAIQADVQALRELATYGIETVYPADENATEEDLSFIYFCLGYSNILGGELFTGLPASNLGEVLSSAQTLEVALEALDQAIAFTDDQQMIAVCQLLKARAYYNLGDANNAYTEATEALAVPELLYQIAYDGVNSLSNEMQNATYDALPNRLAPLPRLDFLDPKYYSTGTPSTDQKPVTLVKAEEAYLILAEIALAQNDIATAKSNLIGLLSLINIRPKVLVDDSGETRNGGNRTDYPLTAVKVRFDANSDFKSGLVLDRQQGSITVSTVSGTHVTAADIDNAQTIDDVLYHVYLMRQEVFMSEGRRLTDLGIKYPISQIEQDNNSNVSDEYIEAQIPSFVADKNLDDFSTDADGNITITVDMNKIIVENKNDVAIVPFF
ncbi:tetratricopeptide repeat protein [Robertkochia solimangrovi]|uniref:tetratricopeptide repeat protein n=1 Tax=Robertkochia solimangrovi TaxID=2213046 RepID=UPI00117DADBC|nr:tetratricopeptide repeat protein [Robertkochia solimangrovi]TRZ43534.1 tetratricopeptide repeat protein [Robertkochia solimangrovi]